MHSNKRVSEDFQRQRFLILIVMRILKLEENGKEDEEDENADELRGFFRQCFEKAH